MKKPMFDNKDGGKTHQCLAPECKQQTSCGKGAYCSPNCKRAAELAVGNMETGIY